MFKSSTNSNFDRIVEKATSQLNLEPDWASILEVSDLIRSGDVPAQYALQSIKKRTYSENPHVQKWSLVVLESCVKNCGKRMHDEISTHHFMDEIRLLIKTNDVLRDKLLELVKNWAVVFKNASDHKVVVDTYNLLKAEGWKFPSTKEVVTSEAMFEADVAPDWSSGDLCNRCRTAFSIWNRQHHCRACGLVYCGKCSAKSCILPKFGIEKEVRVCDSCHDKHSSSTDNNNSGASGRGDTVASKSKKRVSIGGVRSRQISNSSSSDDSDDENSNKKVESNEGTSDANSSRQKSEQEIAEEEELQMALALSLSEVSLNNGGEKVSQSSPNRLSRQHDNKKQTAQELDESSSLNAATSQLQDKSEENMSVRDDVSSIFDEETLSPELLRYLNRDYWDSRKDSGADAGIGTEEQPGSSAVGMNRDESLNHRPGEQPSAPTKSTYSSTTTASSTSDGGSRGVETSKMMDAGGVRVGGTVLDDDFISDKKGMATVGSTSSDDLTLDDFVSTLKTQTEIFLNRMNSNSSRGRSIANDSSVQTLFMNSMALHSKLLKNIQEQEDKRLHFEGLQDKLTQIRDARAALDALREEERERRNAERVEAERLRQEQMNQKLKMTRLKKQEYLQYQRQLAMQRMQEQEMELLANRQQRGVVLSSNQVVTPNNYQPNVYMPSYTASPQSGPQPYVIAPGGPQEAVHAPHTQYVQANYMPQGVVSPPPVLHQPSNAEQTAVPEHTAVVQPMSASATSGLYGTLPINHGVYGVGVSPYHQQPVNGYGSVVVPSPPVQQQHDFVGVQPTSIPVSSAPEVKTAELITFD